MALDVSAYIPKGQKKGFGKSPHLNIPTEYSSDFTDAGDYIPPTPLGKLLNFFSMPSLMNSLSQGEGITINPSKSKNLDQMKALIGHEETHAIANRSGWSDKKNLSPTAALYLKQKGIDDSGDSEGPAYASEFGSTNIFPSDLAQQIQKSFGSTLTPQLLNTYTAITQGR